MKKIVPLILILALMMSMSANALASEVSNEEAVTALYATTPADNPVISVNIEWEGMNFTYNGASGPVWDATTHQYLEQEGGWAENEAKITITNHSDVMLKAQFDYQQETAFDDISMRFTSEAPYIGSAYTKAEGEGAPCQIQVLAVPVGDLSETVTEETKIGSIKVTVQTEDDYATVVGAIEELYAGIPNPDDPAITRGTAFYGASTDKDDVESAYFGALELMGQGDAEEADKNTALNLLLTSYYNALRIGQ